MLVIKQVESPKEKRERVYSVDLKDQEKNQPLLPLKALKTKGKVVGEFSLKPLLIVYSCLPLCLYRNWLDPSFPFLPVKNIIFISSLHSLPFVPGLSILNSSKSKKKKK